MWLLTYSGGWEWGEAPPTDSRGTDWSHHRWLHLIYVCVGRQCTYTVYLLVERVFKFHLRPLIVLSYLSLSRDFVQLHDVYTCIRVHVDRGQYSILFIEHGCICKHTCSCTFTVYSKWSTLDNGHLWYYGQQPWSRINLCRLPLYVNPWRTATSILHITASCAFPKQFIWQKKHQL